MKGGQEYINENYDEEAIEHFTMAFDGKIYKAPFYVTTTGIAYNKDMFKKIRLGRRKTVRQNRRKPLKNSENTRKKLTNPAEKEYGIIIPIKKCRRSRQTSQDLRLHRAERRAIISKPANTIIQFF
ncbi:MAG: extracellular solute-binding protein [Clostridiales bacterium]|nr:MAG: extracellular solute-binding protein [Clostridiales bacterium]